MQKEKTYEWENTNIEYVETKTDDGVKTIIDTAVVQKKRHWFYAKCFIEVSPEEVPVNVYDLPKSLTEEEE